MPCGDVIRTDADAIAYMDVFTASPKGICQTCLNAACLQVWQTLLWNLGCLQKLILTAHLCTVAISDNQRIDMPVVIYIDAENNRRRIDVEAGYSLMEGGYNQQLKGMLAECGGAAACGTCHCYVDTGWLDKLPAVEDLEEAMLCALPERRSNSRLACQVLMTEALDGIVLRIADN